MKRMLTMLLAACLMLCAGSAQAEQVQFRDYDAETGTFTNVVRACTPVTSATRTLGSGWYAVAGEVAIPEGANLTVSGTAHLVLCDGASLTVNNAGTLPGVSVSPGNALSIYAQTAGTGRLTATGGKGCAGIGGGEGGSGGTVTINGGTVTAMGGYAAADIGGGEYGSGGTVTMSGGRVTAANIGGGWASRSDGMVTMFGGVFAYPIKGEWPAEGYAIGGNSDPATSAEYPYSVMPAAFTVTIGDHPHSTVQWTYGDGSVMSSVSGTSFKVGTGLNGVRVVFAPEYGYRFADESETGVRALVSPVAEDCTVSAPAVEESLCSVTFAVGEGIRRAACACGGVTNELAAGETALVFQLGTRVELIVEEEPIHYPFAGGRTFEVNQETMRMEIFARPIPKGMEGNPFQVGGDVFATTNAAGALTIADTGR